MKIVVCVKIVPVSDSIITISEDRCKIEPQNIKFDINPYDEYAIEAAVQNKERFGGEVIAVSMGPERDGIALKRALALGADRLIHIIINDDLLSDPVATAGILAQAIQPLDPDFVFCGKVAIDTGNGLTGPLLALKLGMPFITGVCELNIEDKIVTAAKETESGKAILKCASPCLITTEKGLNKPRYPSLKDILLARKKESVTTSIDTFPNRSLLTGLFYPEARPAGVILGNDISAVPELIRRLHDEVRVL